MSDSRGGTRVYESLDDALVGTVHAIQDEGVQVAPRDMATRDLLGHMFIIRDPRARVLTVRPWRTGYGPAKVMWDIAGRGDLASIEWWNPNGARYSDDGVSMRGENYGQRWAGYLSEAIELLMLDRDSRRAWVPIWRPTDLVGAAEFYSRTGKNVPCTLGFGLRIVDDCLVLQCVMRSQSVVGVLPYDVYCMTVMQELIANELGIDVGWYEHLMLSAHVYEREHEAVAEIYEAQWDLNAEPMRPNPTKLSFAEELYPQIFDTLTGAEQLPDDTARNHPDPVIAQAIQGAREIMAEEAG